MANEQNLKPCKTKKEARERGKKGGIASGIARRKKKSMLEAARAVLQADMPEQVLKNVQKLTGTVDDDENSIFYGMTAVMANLALKGNVQAYNSLKDIVTQIENQGFDSTVEDDPLSKALEGLGKELTSDNNENEGD